MISVEDDDVEDFVDENRTVAVDIKYKITSFGADFLVDGLVDRFTKGDIYVPDFQRSFVWTKPQASRFIESILLGLPIPGIFLYREEETNKMLVVDGLLGTPISSRAATTFSFTQTHSTKSFRRQRLLGGFTITCLNSFGEMPQFARTSSVH
ncbi:hypothetical protein ACVII1_001122 [Bradyrhizobium elkanii]|uniref:GmrSD restriction endonucleases N-terminal domain-containing protein n=1 Tax=Bradyrhizobium elkanii TaxID=29448 RepID=A0A8I1YGW3_BRAEL|nr:DUF262 domain-containing protein [Bradyrhizobium elkanii]MBP1297941.1 hypothetical protein [Bradyrhizobium elkanii]WLA36567.1 DUF262 domain-containing protein [Bradyrhizobium elkanii]